MNWSVNNLIILLVASSLTYIASAMRDPLGYVDGMGLYEYERSSPNLHLDPSGLLTPDTFWNNWNGQQRAEWINNFKNSFSRMIDDAAQRHCIPKELLASIIANEMIDYSSREEYLELWGFGNSVGPGQITPGTVDREGLWTQESQRNSNADWIIIEAKVFQPRLIN